MSALPVVVNPQRIEAAAATRQSYRNGNYVLSELDSAAIGLRDNVWWDV